MSLIKSTVANNGVLITSYNGVVTHQEHLVAEQFDYVILDEGHKIRNPDSQARTPPAIPEIYALRES